MNQQKTGALIAQQRKDLNLTQKQLAEKIGVSDRAISKWERGAGFPDVSLIEPLANALGLTLPELFRGERHSPAPADDISAREALHFALPQLKRTIRKYRWIAIILCVLLILMAACLLIPSARNYWIPSNSPTSAGRAVALAPEILITKADYDLIDVIIQDPELGWHYVPYPLGQQVTSFSLENEDARAFTRYFDYLDDELHYCGISIHGSSITVSYATSTLYVALAYNQESVTKTVVLSEYPVWDQDGNLLPMNQRHGNRIDLLNENNETFYQGGYVTGWLEYFRTTYY